MQKKIGRPKKKATKKVRMTVILEHHMHVAFMKNLQNRDISASQFFRAMVFNLCEMGYKGGFDTYPWEKTLDKQLPEVKL